LSISSGFRRFPLSRRREVVSFAGALELSAGTTTLSTTVLPVAGGVGRLVPGEVSDRVDRERTMAVSFLLCGAGVLAVAAGLSTSRTDSKTCEQYSSPITHI
jgi:nitrate/nitrite transporter NarK